MNNFDKFISDKLKSYTSDKQQLNEIATGFTGNQPQKTSTIPGLPQTPSGSQQTQSSATQQATQQATQTPTATTAAPQVAPVQMSFKNSDDVIKALTDFLQKNPTESKNLAQKMAAMMQK